MFFYVLNKKNYNREISNYLNKKESRVGDSLHFV